MSREWKPGEVGMIDTRGDDALVTRRGDGYWIAVRSGMVLNPYLEPRPLVVIDPEDREAVERLGRLLWPHYAGNEFARLRKAEITADALREFADPKPPKPVEPTGLGAVVEDAEGQKWVRLHTHWGDCNDWYIVRSDQYRAEDTGYEGRRKWSTLDVVRVLSEGVA